MKKILSALLCCIAVVVMFLACNDVKVSPQTRVSFPSYNPGFPPPPGTKDVFELAQNYPDNFKAENYPWTSIDFKKDYKGYLAAVLKYCIEGNEEVDFKVQDNKVRKWYNAPWLHYGQNGREYHHGLTRERPIPPNELGLPSQNVSVENWAIGFYNEPGGYSIGKVWTASGIPNPTLSGFPENTVSFKLLFTAATVAQVPFLEGSKEWTANIYPCNPDAKNKPAGCGTIRVDSTVRLMQIDVAIKDKRAGETGWVMGTFIYDASRPGKTVWERMNPVGIMWGDDSKIDTMISRPGAFINPYLKETVLNPDLIRKEIVNARQAFMSHHGLGGRLNGPIDNPISSCISCHSKAAVTDQGAPAPMANFALRRDSFPLSEFHKYFSEVKGGGGKWTFNATTYNKLDYSLQLAAGIRNFFQARIDSIKSNNKSLAPSNLKDLPEVTRDGLKQEH